MKGKAFIESDIFTDKVESYFSYLITEFDFKLSKREIRGNVFYNIEYTDKKKVISISYENIEDYLLVIVFILKNGELPDYDDKTKTLHLENLNKLLMPGINKSEIITNNNYFLKFNPVDEIERKLLKSARELRLCLTYFNKLD